MSQRQAKVPRGGALDATTRVGINPNPLRPLRVQQAPDSDRKALFVAGEPPGRTKKGAPRAQPSVRKRLLNCKRFRGSSKTPRGKCNLFILFLGGPGSGKSYFFEHGGEKYGTKYSFLRKHCEGYAALMVDKDVCLNFLQPVSRSEVSPLMMDALDELFKERKNVVYIGTGKSSDKTLARIKLAYKYKYRVKIVFMDTPLETAWLRVESRAPHSVNRMSRPRFDEINTQIRSSMNELDIALRAASKSNEFDPPPEKYLVTTEGRKNETIIREVNSFN
jgi:hypothetical protein